MNNEEEQPLNEPTTIPTTGEPKPKKVKKTQQAPGIKYKYSEDKSLAELSKYVASTYSQHYVGKNLQAIDIWESLGSHISTHRDTAIKYLMRYGKKNGNNRSDLLKA